MPTDSDLCQLRRFPQVQLRRDDEVDMARYDACTRRRAFQFAPEARSSSATTNFRDGIYLGRKTGGGDVWAHLVGDLANTYCCDAPRRAFISFQWVDGSDVQAVVVRSLHSLADVAGWDDGIKGQSLVERFCFIYDALVGEAQTLAWLNDEY